MSFPKSYIALPQKINELFKKSQDSLLKVPIMLSAFYGLRKSEVLGIKWSTIDFDNNTITVKHTITEIRENGKVKIIAKV